MTYPTWFSSWRDPSTVVHRIISIGGVVGAIVELGVLNLGFRHIVFLLILPVGLIISALLFYSHHHPGESPDIKRQHDIMATAQLFAGITLGGARLFTIDSFGTAWPWMMAIVAYLFVSYTEQGTLPASGHSSHH